VPALRVQDLTVEFGSGGEVTRPLDRFHMDAPAGSLVLLLGPSGSGKTTLLSCLAAILSPTSGSITFGAIDIAALTGKERTLFRRRTVGIVFQAFNLVPSLTATENVLAPLLAAGVARAPAAKRAAELIDRVDLGNLRDFRPGELWGGLQQRVAIARALVHDPPLLLADEPTAHLDHAQVEGVLELLAGLMDGDRVMVIATHDDRVHALGGQRVDLAHRAPA
jgi:putative ABC transport system ATP-binding protein